MPNYWKNVVNFFNGNNTKKYILIFILIVLFTIIFIYTQRQHNDMDTLYKNIALMEKESFMPNFNNTPTIYIDNIDIKEYTEKNKLKLLDGNIEFNFKINIPTSITQPEPGATTTTEPGATTTTEPGDKQPVEPEDKQPVEPEDKQPVEPEDTFYNVVESDIDITQLITIDSIKFVNISGNYQNITLDSSNWQIVDRKECVFTQYLNLDTEYKMILDYTDIQQPNKPIKKTIDKILYTSSEFNYKTKDSRITTEDINLSLATNDNVRINTNTNNKINMQQFNYVEFKIIKPELSKVRAKLLQSSFDNNNARTQYNIKLAQFDNLIPLKFDAKLSILKKTDSSEVNTSFMPMPDNELQVHRTNYPIPERIELPNPSCSKCELYVRNVIKDVSYNLRIRLEYYYLDNIKNIRTTPYLDFNFTVNDEDTNNPNSFGISRLNIVNTLETNNMIQTTFKEYQTRQDTILDNIENNLYY